jgi:hypothetical protein
MFNTHLQHTVLSYLHRRRLTLTASYRHSAGMEIRVPYPSMDMRYCVSGLRKGYGTGRCLLFRVALRLFGDMHRLHPFRVFRPQSGRALNVFSFLKKCNVYEKNMTS